MILIVVETSFKVSSSDCCPLLQAYSVYDEEIGYCQGQSFLAAVLLLHVSSCISAAKEKKKSISFSNILESSEQIFNFHMTEVYLPHAGVTTALSFISSI